MSPSVTSSVKLSAYTFFGKQLGDICGLNGLPLTPNSIRIFGKSQFLKTIDHPNLTKYLDIIRGKHERVIVVTEHFGTSLNWKQLPSTDRYEIFLKILYQTASGLNHIFQQKTVHHNLEPENILVDELFNVKLYNYGLYHMTGNGNFVQFPIGSIKYLAPERILGNHGNIKSDVWSFGLIMVELVFEINLWSNLKFNQIARKVLSYCSGNNILEKIAREHDRLEVLKNLDPCLKELMESCLSILSKSRPTPEEILQHSVFDKSFDTLDFKPPPRDSIVSLSPLERLDLNQVYYLWQLTGGDVHVELKKEGLIRSEAPILTIPRLVLLNGKAIASKRTQSSLYDHRIVILNLQNLTERLSLIPKTAFYPLLYSPKLTIQCNVEMQTLPLMIREKDIEYQFHRVILFARLLKAYPYTRDLIVNEAKIDIPPLYRGPIWACLLNVLPNGKYEKNDKVSPNPTDRQIEVDVPRCHQYDELLSSPTGHNKLKRLLKAWVTAHPQYVYWQGLDSLTAPFLFLNFNDEELAFLCLINFIPKYLHWFFLKDNSLVIKEYLSKFFQLTTFHEPQLAKHLKTINFIADLFAIPWFLTMFSHVFPLHKILHLWDKLILGDASYPFYIGISVLRQLKSTLLDSGFNECILLFSDLPDIIIETCVKDSQIMYEMTPKSVSHRKFVLRSYEPGNLDIDNVELEDIQREVSPRISAQDLIDLLKNSPDQLAVVDLRSPAEFNRSHIENSINIPFTSIMLGDRRLEALNVVNLDKLMDGRIVVIVSVSHENACLFADFLVDCQIPKVCVLHKGFNLLHSISPSILV